MKPTTWLPLVALIALLCAAGTTRQGKADQPDQLGTVHFPISCRPEA
jgi:hypothetical protein